MPLLKGTSKYKNTAGEMDTKIYLRNTGTPTHSAGGDPSLTEQDFGPLWAKVEYLSRKQMETEVANRITSIQQIRFTIRNQGQNENNARKSGSIWIASDGATAQYNILTISKDLGRGQFLEIVTELRQ